jgi:glycosyltransferase involved in cell wall biosynthesis
MLVSVVIPAYNEEKYIGQTLEALKEEEHPNFDFEVIVADSSSTDRTVEIAKKNGAKVIVTPKVSPAFARQRGIEGANGEIVACLDADTIPSVDWLKTIVQEFSRDKKVVGLTGRVEILERNLLSKVAFLFFQNIFYPLNFLLGKTIFNGQNFAIKKWAFSKIGGLNTSLHSAEDADLGVRLGKVGKVILSPKALVLTSARREKEGISLNFLLRWPLSYLKLVWGINLGNWEKKPFPAIR